MFDVLKHTITLKNKFKLDELCIVANNFGRVILAERPLGIDILDMKIPLKTM